ncbi:uncharacterized protein HMPREF1541_03611 [Cyphellophora europaea CBS 101466]|uniref:Zn(2)-C6 fungal-type domain-containing protein n=1 Tax=Cyphellophora europaea (strain CBS 101466) TaxID=1220924 RepID=W2RZB7_CYPE1|nr:uncharacterized protein HMPREF1541_03611 [Cyphellophora europaea CBS 101466]ETN41675.1 hypothetical protein HMPREF1541_03611 [Cyphellophora europaea CBS 101466]
MAGPGGGPPRKSHTKSRKGCRTCKRRHIRCDETFPQCKNCSKHNCRCDYMDMPAAGEEPMKGSRPPDLMMSSDLQKRLDKWRLTGESLLPDLRSPDPMYWTRFSTIDLRLIHHIVTLATDLHTRGYSPCTSWAARMPTLIPVALSHDFVMSAMLALSASHLAWQTKNPDTENLAYHHRGVALKGLHGGLGQFSREVSEAILAASMLLSWQAPEWKSWASLQQGISTVMSSMRPWAHESELARFLDVQRSISRARTPSTPTFPNATTGIPDDEVRRVDEMITALHNLKLRLATNPEMAEHAGHVLDYLTELRQDFPIPSPERAFARLQPLRDLIFWLPPAVLRAGESDLPSLTLLSHLYATALTIEGVFPEIGGAYLGGMCLQPIERIHEILNSRRSQQPQDSSCQVALQIVEYPMRVVAAYKTQQRKTSIGLEQHASVPYRHSPHQSPSYMASHMQLASPPETTSTLYSNSPVQTPQGLPTGTGTYFSGSQSLTSGRRDSPGLRPPQSGLGERSSSMSMVYGQHATGAASPHLHQQQQQHTQVRSSHDSNPSRMEHFGQQQQSAAASSPGTQPALSQSLQQQQGYQQYYSGMTTAAPHHSHHNRFVTPSQLWA